MNGDLTGLADRISILSKAASTLVVLLLAYGLSKRRRPAVHMPVMKTCFAIDLVNVIAIEVSGIFLRHQSAVAKSVDATLSGRSPLLVFHITVSLITIACYAVALVTGRRLYRRGTGRGIHRANAAIFIPARLANYVTSFFV